MNHSCAIQAGTGAVVCWGRDSWGQSTPPPSVDGTTGTATAIAAGYEHSCAIQAETGAVVCWGDDSFGQSTPPPSVDGTTGTASAIATGGGAFCIYGPSYEYSHSCAIQAETGAVVCWGYDSDELGQLTPPPSVDGTTGTATAISAGFTHSCAIQAETGAVVCWSGPTPPPSVDGTTGTATAMAAGGSWISATSCAIQAETGAVVCWGYDSDELGQLTPPPSVDGTTGTATAIAAGHHHTLAIRTPECSDGFDNDGDGLTDYPDDPLCDDGEDVSEAEICDDGLDNDGDGFTDFGGGDLGCANPDDSSENDPSLPCDDGIDNDGDGLTDYPDDPGCDDLLDNSEAPCDDGIDNDGDGLTDYPDDPGCDDLLDNSEAPCDDGIDNDGDGLTDYPDDPGCDDLLDNSEAPCDDGIDNDGDGLTDYPDDPGCDDLLDNSESPDPMQAEVKLKIGLKFNKPSKDKILVKITNWQLPAGVVPTDVTVNVGGAECTGTLDAEGKFQSPDRRDSITMKRSKKSQLWNIAMKRKNNDFAADLWDEGCTNADNPKPGLPVTVPLTIEVGGVAYGRNVDLVYKSKLDAKGIAK